MPFNLRAFRLGRLWVHDRARVSAMLQDAGATPAPSAPVAPLSLDALIEDRRARLVAYQDAAYAQRFTDFMARVTQAERALGDATSDMPLSSAVARSLYKLMAYKDEYEVARLHTDTAFLEKINGMFEGDFKLNYHMAPPLIATESHLADITERITKVLKAVA